MSIPYFNVYYLHIWFVIFFFFFFFYQNIKKLID